MTHNKIENLYFSFELLKQELKRNITDIYTSFSMKKCVKLQELRIKYAQFQDNIDALNQEDSIFLCKLQGKRNKKDLVGDIFYKFLVIEYIKVKNRLNKDVKKKSAHWKVVNLQTYKLSIKSTNYLKTLYDVRKPLIYWEIGTLKVINGPFLDKAGKILWLCKCICGNTVYKPDTILRTKKAKYCGPYCLLNQKGRERTLKTWEKNMKQISQAEKYFKKEYGKLSRKKLNKFSPKTYEESNKQLINRILREKQEEFRIKAEKKILKKKFIIS